MKINSGPLKGMRIIIPKNEITRPTLSRVREAVFNMLRNYLPDAVFWDLFSGSGALGLVALSLGAAEVVFVEQDPPAIQALRQNIEEAKKRFLSNGDEVPQIGLLPHEFNRAWENLKKRKQPDIVWADPPYKESVKWTLFLLKELPSFVSQGTLLVMEMLNDDYEAAEKNQAFVAPQWELVKARKYSSSIIVIWRCT